jgi:hypothetical protein
LVTCSSIIGRFCCTFSSKTQKCLISDTVTVDVRTENCDVSISKFIVELRWFSTKFKLILHNFPGKILQMYRWLEDDRSRMSVSCTSIMLSLIFLWYFIAFFVLNSGVGKDTWEWHAFLAKTGWPYTLP